MNRVTSQQPILRNARGFSLIELLVVVAIVALLSTVLVAGLAEIRKSSRESARLVEANSVIQALELYRVANPSGYPATNNTLHGCDHQTCFANLTDELVPLYLPRIPLDPLYGNTQLGYRYCRANAGQYQMLLPVEPSITSPSGTYCTVRNPAPITGTGCWTIAGTSSYDYCE